LEDVIVLPPELKKLMEDLEDNIKTIHIDREKLLGELHGLDDNVHHVNESLSMSGNVCPRCGKPL
jgi:hypothetical protein